MRPIPLSQAQLRRLGHLAQKAGRTTTQMLAIVLRDGFEYCEWQLSESRASDTEARHHGTVSHSTVMREARELLESAHGQRRRRARPVEIKLK